MTALRVLLAVVGFALLYWAYAILDNIWTYNDSGTAAYIVYAAFPGLSGLLLLYLAVKSRAGSRRDG